MDGAPPGEYSVTFELLRAGADERGLDTELDVWKGKYANPDTAPKVTVGSSATTLEPWPRAPLQVIAKPNPRHG